ncbi:Hypothetical predicted protein [Marmota monax]|uniref:Uncharacterized protein n=1 Tax=Marmota monax TaxID=9995 RepID=A0A5E4CYA8_MARMO|nr:hypothetical protein GHT09_014159 [Marmota monax]VTJ86069.1 Hypothetical predicted protein [Marmota monax]
MNESKRAGYDEQLQSTDQNTASSSCGETADSPEFSRLVQVNKLTYSATSERTC